MSPEEAPIGTICVYGHTANGVTVRKYEDGFWRLTSQGPMGRVMSDEEVARSGYAVYIPGR